MQYLRLVVSILLSGRAAEKASEYQKWADQPTPKVSVPTVRSCLLGYAPTDSGVRSWSSKIRREKGASP